MKTIGYSRPLALWRVISVTSPSSSLRVVRVGDERHLLEELGQRRLARDVPRGVVLGGDVDELLEVLDPALRLDRPLGLERLQIAGLLEHLLEQPATGALGRARSRRTSIVPMKRPSALTAGGAEPGHLLRRGGRLPDRTPIVLANATPAQSRSSRSPAGGS